MSLIAMRVKTTILLALVLCVLAYAMQASAQALPGIGTVNHLAVDVIKVTTNPTDPKDTADINGPVGGDSVSIYVKVQYGNAVTNINSVTVIIHESGVETSVGSLSLTSYTQLADSGSGDATLHTRVYTGTWNTLTTTPLIYNNDYCFNATVDYDRNNTHASPAFVSLEVKVPVKNLWITSIDSQYAPEPFLLVKAGGTQEIEVNFEHYKTTADYQVIVTIRETPDPTVIVAELESGTIHSKNTTLTWNPSTDPVTGWPYGGYFCFDVEVKEGTESVKYCSESCTVASHNLTNDGTTANYTYTLSEAPKAESIKVYWCSHLVVQDISSDISDQVRNTTNPVPYTLAAGATSIRGIIVGQQNNAENRGKDYLQILPANEFNGYKVRIGLHLRLTGVEDTSLQFWKDVWKVTNRGVEHVDGYPQVSAWSKTANTGNGTKINKDDQCWQNNGPCPPSNTVQDNFNAGTNTFRPYKLDFGTSLKNDNLSVENNWDDYLWRTGSGTETVDGHTVHTRYTYEKDNTIYHSNKSYWVNASNNTCAFTEYPEATPPPVTRTYIYLHEDTNYSKDGGTSRVTVKGTNGCTGLAPGGMVDFYQQIAAMTSDNRVWYLSVNGSETTNIPYYILNSNEVFNPTEYIYGEYPIENVGCFFGDGEWRIGW